LGLGIMGSLQAAHLVRAGHELTVWSRTSEKADAWAREHGAAVADTPAQAAVRAEILFTMLVDGPQVAAVLDGVESADGLLCVDMDALTTIMGAGSGASAMLSLKAGPMRAHDYTTLFKLEHMLKDVRLCLEEAEADGVPFPAAAAVRDVLSAGMGRGLGDADFAGLVEVLEG